MDERVTSLLGELEAATSIEPRLMRDRITELFGVVESEQERVTLLMLLDAVIGAAIRHQECEGRDTTPLRNALLADKRALVIQEAMGSNELAEPTEQLRILEREIAAGRLEKDDFYRLTADAAKVLGPPPTGREKMGLFKRLFG